MPLTPDTVSYYQFGASTDMHAAFSRWASPLSEGDCARVAPARGEWLDEDGVVRGSLACFTTVGGDRAMLWGHNDAAVLVIALDPILSPANLYEWWSKHAALAR